MTRHFIDIHHGDPTFCTIIASSSICTIETAKGTLHNAFLQNQMLSSKIVAIHNMGVQENLTNGCQIFYIYHQL
jgi:hypothetical protein